MVDYKEKLLKYVKDNLEVWQIKQGWDYIGKKEPIPYELVFKIEELAEDFCEDNELDVDWWQDQFEDAEELFINL